MKKYFFGLLGLCLAVFFAVVQNSSAQDSSFLSDEELNQIISEVEQEAARIEGEVVTETSGTIEATDCSVTAPCPEELATAVTYLYDAGITKFNTPETFMSDKQIRRDEAAKMYVLLAKKRMMNMSDAAPACSFADLSKAHADLLDVIKQSCQYGFFKGSKGNFMPIDSITNAQATVVLIRMLEGLQDETKGHYATQYMQIAQEKGLLAGLGIEDKSMWDKPATRGLVARLLYRADK